MGLLLLLVRGRTLQVARQLLLVGSGESTPAAVATRLADETSRPGGLVARLLRVSGIQDQTGHAAAGCGPVCCSLAAAAG
jgi:hypothetical protein